MTDQKSIRLDELRQPGMRRILEAMKLIEDEAPGLLDEASIAAIEISKDRGQGGNAPQSARSCQC
jgi:hypothetical protein